MNVIVVWVLVAGVGALIGAIMAYESRFEQDPSFVPGFVDEMDSEDPPEFFPNTPYR